MYVVSDESCLPFKHPTDVMRFKKKKIIHPFYVKEDPTSMDLNLFPITAFIPYNENNIANNINDSLHSKANVLTTTPSACLPAEVFGAQIQNDYYISS